MTHPLGRVGGLSLICCILIWAPPLTVVAQPPQAIDDVLAGYAQPGMPGCSVGVVEGGRLAVQASYGLADIENRIPSAPRPGSTSAR
jgi:CubicO group peptidase (beta-lactamase class C family)